MNNRGRILAGIILILLGLLIIFLKFSTFHHPNSFLLLIGGLFLAAYFYNKSYGLLIPGCLLLGIALSSGGMGYYHTFNNSSSWGLGFGFFAIFLIDLLYQGKTHWWPLIPGTILVITGIRKSSFWMVKFWPVLIILLGLYIIFKSLLPKQEEHHMTG